jgi:hypothetical protein
MSYLRHLCLFAQSDGLCFCFIFFIVCTLFVLLPLRYSLTFIVIKHGTVCLTVGPFSFYFLLVQCRQSFC